MQPLTLKSLFDGAARQLELSWIAGEEYGAKVLNPDSTPAMRWPTWWGT